MSIIYYFVKILKFLQKMLSSDIPENRAELKGL